MRAAPGKDPRRTADKWSGRAAREAGVSLIELLVVVIAVGILIGIALKTLFPLMAKSERVYLMKLEADLRSALVMETAQRIVHGKGGSVPELAGSNPMDLMLETPATYLGEMNSPDPVAVPSRSWYFDTGDGRLVYRVASEQYFVSANGLPARVEYAVTVDYADANDNGRYDPGADRFHGVRLRPVDTYRWVWDEEL